MSKAGDGSNVPILRQIIVGLFAAAVVLFATAVIGTVAFAHADYTWIMNEPRYVDRMGIHCCSDDCKPVDAADLHELPDGIIYLPTQEKLQYRTDEGRNGGIYHSAEPNPPKDRRPWVCRRHDKLRCIFRVMPEG